MTGSLLTLEQSSDDEKIEKSLLIDVTSYRSHMTYFSY